MVKSLGRKQQQLPQTTTHQETGSRPTNENIDDQLPKLATTSQSNTYTIAKAAGAV